MFSIRHPHPVLRVGLLALVGVGAAACLDNTAELDSEPIIGTWVASVPGGTDLLEITESEITYYRTASDEDCAERTIYTLESLGDDEYLLTSTVSTATIEARITAAGGELRWQTAFGSAFFLRTTADPSTLEICAGGGDDPALDCTGLPAVEAGQDVTDSLTVADAMERGRYYDVYGFQPQAQDTVAVAVTSATFDTYLYVYDADGALLAENDDAEEGSTDAALTLQVVPGCYRVVVTSFDIEETGGYTLRID